MEQVADLERRHWVVLGREAGRRPPPTVAARDTSQRLEKLIIGLLGLLGLRAARCARYARYCAVSSVGRGDR